MPDKPIKEQLNALFEEACVERRRLLDSLTETQRRAQGTIDHWAFKDMVCHIAFWTQTHADRLAAFRRGEETEGPGEALEVNDRVFEAHKDCSLEEALDLVDRAYGDLQAELNLLSEGDLMDKEKYHWTRGRPLYSALYGESFSHPLVHFAQAAIEHGNIEEARRLNERMAETMVALDDLPYAQGVAAYNLACFYALTGRPGRAIELLGKALPLAPSLVDWSKEDSDLVSLRELPEYLALYE